MLKDTIYSLKMDYDKQIKNLKNADSASKASLDARINKLQSIINSLRIENSKLTHNLNTYKEIFEKYKDCIYLKDKYDFFKKIKEFDENINDYKLCIIFVLY